MPVLNGQAADEVFRANEADAVSYLGNLVTLPSQFVWSTQGGNRVEATGTGFTYSGGVPTGGDVTQIRIDLGSDGDFAAGTDIDIVVTNVAADLASLVSTASQEASAIGFWEAVLGGSDTIRAVQQDDATLFGDFLSVASEVFDPVSLSGGDDLITSNGLVEQPILTLGQLNLLIGDAVTVMGASQGMIAYPARLDGGNDTIIANGLALYNIVGDAQSVFELGQLEGGNDVLTSNQTGTPFRFPVLIVGDALVNDGGAVAGGADTIVDSDFPFVVGGLIGDVRTHEGGTTAGGMDRILGRGGQDLIAGEVLTQQGGIVNGGADSAFGGGDSDIICGDVYRMSGGTVNAGNDQLFGDDGNDSIVGDVGSVSGAVSVDGGDDFLFGGSGNDTLIGDVGGGTAIINAVQGNDTLNGGQGNDRLVGGLGVDWAGFGSDTSPVVVDLTAGTATGQGSDTLFGIENVNGSSGDDRITGNAAVNSLLGQLGDDTVLGGEGADVLNGGAGGDSLSCGPGFDTASGGEGADTVTGGFGNDLLFGNDGNDRLNGSQGNDTLVGGLGADVLNGDAGADIFDFNFVADSAPGANRDTVSDFSQAENDAVDLATIDANSLLAGNQAFTFIGAAAFTGVAGQLRFINSTLIGDVNGNGSGDFSIAMPGAGPLGAGDLVL